MNSEDEEKELKKFRKLLNYWPMIFIALNSSMIFFDALNWSMIF